MWGVSDCERPRRGDLSYNITNGAYSSRGGSGGYQLGFFSTALLTVGIALGMEVMKTWD